MSDGFPGVGWRYACSQDRLVSTHPCEQLQHTTAHPTRTATDLVGVGVVAGPRAGIFSLRAVTGFAARRGVAGEDGRRAEADATRRWLAELAGGFRDRLPVVDDKPAGRDGDGREAGCRAGRCRLPGAVEGRGVRTSAVAAVPGGRRRRPGVASMRCSPWWLTTSAGASAAGCASTSPFSSAAGGGGGGGFTTPRRWSSASTLIDAGGRGGGTCTSR